MLQENLSDQPQTPLNCRQTVTYISQSHSSILRFVVCHIRIQIPQPFGVDEKRQPSGWSVEGHSVGFERRGAQNARVNINARDPASILLRCTNLQGSTRSLAYGLGRKGRRIREFAARSHANRLRRPLFSAEAIMRDRHRDKFFAPWPRRNAYAWFTFWVSTLVIHRATMEPRRIEDAEPISWRNRFSRRAHRSFLFSRRIQLRSVARVAWNSSHFRWKYSRKHLAPGSVEFSGREKQAVRFMRLLHRVDD